MPMGLFKTNVCNICGKEKEKNHWQKVHQKDFSNKGRLKKGELIKNHNGFKEGDTPWNKGLNIPILEETKKKISETSKGRKMLWLQKVYDRGKDDTKYEIVNCKNCNTEFEKLKVYKNKNYCSLKCANTDYELKKQTAFKSSKTNKIKGTYLKNSERMKNGGGAIARKCQGGRQSKPEKLLENVLQNLKLNYEKEFILQGKSFDFKIKNVIIEVDGNYWHNYPYGTESDKIKNKIALDNGFKILRFWESEILNNINNVKEIIKNEKL